MRILTKSRIGELGGGVKARRATEIERLSNFSRPCVIWMKMIPVGGYTIRHQRDGDFGLWAAGDGLWEFRDYFTVHEGRDWNSCIFKIFFEVSQNDLWVGQKVGPSDEIFQSSFLTWAVERIARGLRDDEFRDTSIRIDVGLDELRLFDQIAVDKHCDYQIAEGRDLFCSVVSGYPKLGPFRSVQQKICGPTSAHECLNCNLPDTRFMCSQLGHPRLMPSALDTSRMVSEAKCGANQPNIADPATCHAGGHPCWV
jgi:hypothetical protein